jgi:hypothetical protein
MKMKKEICLLGEVETSIKLLEKGTGKIPSNLRNSVSLAIVAIMSHQFPISSIPMPLTLQKVENSSMTP